MEPEVAHDRGHHRVLREGPGRAQPQRRHGHDLVAVHQGAGGVHGQATVGIAVMRDAQVRTGFPHRPR